MMNVLNADFEEAQSDDEESTTKKKSSTYGNHFVDRDKINRFVLSSASLSKYNSSCLFPIESD